MVATPPSASPPPSFGSTVESPATGRLAWAVGGARAAVGLSRTSAEIAATAQPIAMTIATSAKADRRAAVQSWTWLLRRLATAAEEREVEGHGKVTARTTMTVMESEAAMREMEREYTGMEDLMEERNLVVSRRARKQMAAVAKGARYMAGVRSMTTNHTNRALNKKSCPGE